MLAQSLAAERAKCRAQIFKSLYEVYRDTFLREQMKHEEALEREELQAIFDDAYNAFTGFLRIVGVSADMPGKRELKQALEGSREDAAGENGEAEHWESVEEQ